jgi:hypothetical protein
MRKGKAAAKRRGRPPLPPERERFGVKTRLSKELLNKLEVARSETGRSMAQEVELRLEQSFEPWSAPQLRALLGLITIAASREFPPPPGHPIEMMVGDDEEMRAAGEAQYKQAVAEWTPLAEEHIAAQKLQIELLQRLMELLAPKEK